MAFSPLAKFRRWLRRRREMPQGTWAKRFARVRLALTRARGRRPLSKQRRKRRLTGYAIAAGVVLVAMVGGALLSHVDAVEIQDVTVLGAEVVDADTVRERVSQGIAGSYFHLFSKRNTLLFPKSALEQEIAQAFPRLASVTLARESPTELIVSVRERQPYALWCGERKPTVVESVTSACYFLDTSGFLFARAPQFTGGVFFTYYGPLRVSNEDGVIGSRYLSAEQLSRLADFMARVGELRAEPRSLARVSDEDFTLRLEDGSEVRFSRAFDYTAAFTNLETLLGSAAFKEDSATGAPLDYIDLRFDNKVYYKFHHADEQTD